MAKRWPKYCGPHAAGNYGFVWHNGRRVYFSPHPYGTRESHEAYRRWCIENIDNARPPEEPPDSPTVAYLVLQFLVDAENRNASDKEMSHWRIVSESLVKHSGAVATTDFGPRAMLDWMNGLIATDRWSITTIRKYLSKAKRIFKWGVSRELVPATTWTALQTVEAPRADQTAARAPKVVGSVPLDHIEKTVAVVSPVVAAMIRVQLLTGMRSQNLCDMTIEEIDRSAEVWIYRPGSHKSAWRGRGLEIFIGPQAQQIIRELVGDRGGVVFQPSEAAEWRSNQRRQDAAGPVRSKTNGPSSLIGDRYKPYSYRQAVLRGAERAGVPHWHPHQLRHTRATIVRAKEGLEAAQVTLGHSSAKTTEIYAERDRQLAVRVAQELG